MWLFKLAVLPAALLLIYVYQKDTVEKEPFGLLMFLLFLGMLAVRMVIAPEELLGGLVSALPVNSIVRVFLNCLLVVATCEEGVKYLLLRTTRTNPNFNFTFDGIVYAVFIGVGFAMLENILYVVGKNSVALGFMRGISAVPMHCACAVFMGYYFGLSRQSEVRGQRDLAVQQSILAFVIPWSVHGFYDFALLSENAIMYAIVVIFIITVFVFAFRLVNKASKGDMVIAPWT